MALEQDGRHAENIVPVRFVVIGADSRTVLAGAQILGQSGRVDVHLAGQLHQLEGVGDIPLLLMVGAEHGNVEAVEGVLALLGQDALRGLVRRYVAAGETGVFPGFPFQAAATVDLLKQKRFPGNFQVFAQFVFHAMEPLRGSPSVRSNVTTPDGEIVAFGHCRFSLLRSGPRGPRMTPQSGADPSTPPRWCQAVSGE